MQNNLFYTLLSGLPVAAILLFLITRLVSKRDSFEAEVTKEFGDIKLCLSELDKSLAILTKDIEHVSTLAPVLTDLLSKTSKIQSDLDYSFSRIRDLERGAA